MPEQWTIALSIFEKYRGKNQVEATHRVKDNWDIFRWMAPLWKGTYFTAQCIAEDYGTLAAAVRMLLEKRVGLKIHFIFAYCIGNFCSNSIFRYPFFQGPSFRIAGNVCSSVQLARQTFEGLESAPTIISFFKDQNQSKERLHSEEEYVWKIICIKEELLLALMP